MPRGTVTLPSLTYPDVRGRPNPAHPAEIPGGIAGPAPIPSRATTDVRPPAPGGILPGGIAGQVRLFTPSIDKQAPYFLGSNEGFSIRTVDGSPLQWIRRFFNNSAGCDGFIPYQTATTDWTSNQERPEGRPPASAIPVSRKRFAPGAIRKAAYQDEQLFDQLTAPGRPWPIQKSIPFHLRAALQGQPRSQRPYYPKLTRYTPAAAYSQTTETLLAKALQNILPPSMAPSNPQTIGGNPYGSWY